MTENNDFTTERPHFWTPSLDGQEFCGVCGVKKTKANVDKTCSGPRDQG